MLHLLVMIVFFVVGMLLAGIFGAARGQGLASGAIVFVYGAIASLIGLIASMTFCYYADFKKKKSAIRIFATLTFLCLLALTIRVLTMNSSMDTTHNSYDFPEHKVNVKPVSNINHSYFGQWAEDPEPPMGLGFFKPDFFKSSTLYFYGDPNFEKPVQDHSPADSLVFKDLQESSNYELIYAPPWLFPEHNKLEYGIFYFRLQSVGRDFAGVTLNSLSLIEGYVDRNAGEIIYWPEFLLKVHSVEFLSNSDQKIRLKPLEIASEVNVPFDFMSPAEVKEEWMRVQLYDSDYQQVGTGWIRWKKDDKLLISYSLLS
jgi:hypothetical protein